MDILNAVCKVVALILNSLSIWDKMSTYLLGKKRTHLRVATLMG